MRKIVSLRDGIPSKEAKEVSLWQLALTRSLSRPWLSPALYACHMDADGRCRSFACGCIRGLPGAPRGS